MQAPTPEREASALMYSVPAGAVNVFVVTVAVVFGVGSFAHAGVLHAWIGFCHAQEGAG